MTTTLRSVFSACTDARKIGFFLLFLWVFLCLIKLPATLVRIERPQTWEAVISFASVNQLQWGKDVIYTYGPLGYLISDHYWGERYFPILIWSVVFSALITPVFLSLSIKLAGPARLALYAALPWLAISPYSDLGFEALYLLAILILIDRCFPDRRCSHAWLWFACMGLGALSLIKFTFCLFSVFGIVLLFARHLFTGQWKRGCFVFLGFSAAFAAGWWESGQRFANLGGYLWTSAKMTGGYASAMSVPAIGFDLAWGGFQAFCLCILLLNYWRASENRGMDAARYILVGAAGFLAWKEGFVRADLHVVVFFGFAFFLCALMPVLLNASQVVVRNNLRLTVLSLIIPVLSLWSGHSDYIQSGTRNFLPRAVDVAKVIFAPRLFREELSNRLNSIRKIAAIPRIKKMVGASSIDVLGSDQHVAILSDLAYDPHPVFQSYGAYDGELQDINSSFFDSHRAPSFVLWRYGTIDYRFPTLDDGRVILHILGNYTPMLKESAFVLWKRRMSPPISPAFGDAKDGTGRLETWLPISGGHALWLKIKVRSTLTGSLVKFFFRASRLSIDVQTERGEAMRFNLIPANAASGFLLNPFLVTEESLLNKSARSRIVAIRVAPEYGFCFDHRFDYSLCELKDFPFPDGNGAIASRPVSEIQRR